jgi:acetolactate synthase-1/2/3 large subunit
MINQAFKTGGTHLIDVPIDYSQNKRLLIDELRINHRVPSNSKD